MSKFSDWWNRNLSLKYAIQRSLKGTDYEDMSFGEILAAIGTSKDDSILGNLIKSHSGSGMTTAEKDTMATQLANQQILNEEEFARKIQFYEDFESPSAMVNQYRDAGLNPMLLAGGAHAGVSASGGVGSAGSAAAASPSSSSPLASLIGLLQFGLQAKTTKVNNANTSEQTIAQRIENRWKEKFKGIEYQKAVADAKTAEEQTKLTAQNVKKAIEDTSYARVMALFAPQYFQSTIDKASADAILAGAQARLNEKEIENLNTVIEVHKKEVEQIDAIIAKIESEIALNMSQEKLNAQMVRESGQRIEKMKNEIELLGKQIGLTQKDIDYYIWNHPRSSSAFGLKWNNSSSSGTQRNKLSPEVTDAELLMLCRERFGYEAVELMENNRKN